MDGTIGMDEARALVGDALLWPRVRDFLWDFAPSIHPSWLDGLTVGRLDGSDFDHLETTVKLSDCQTVKRHILASFHVEPCFHTFPKDDGSRLLLLDAATLDAIAKWLGALACADALRKVTDSATVRNLKAALPGVYPEVFGYAAYFARFDLAAKYAKHAKGADSLDVNAIMAAGLRLLFSCFSNIDAGLVKRAVLKLPRSLCELCDLCGEREERPSELTSVKKLLKLKFPEAYSLCC